MASDFGLGACLLSFAVSMTLYIRRGSPLHTKQEKLGENWVEFGKPLLF